MGNKLEFTKKVLSELEPEHGIDLDTAMVLWWQDPRPESGFRLTNQGHKTLQDLGLEHWNFEISSGTPARPQHLIVLNKCITMPYFLDIGKKPCLSFYGSREATMYSLYGDIDRFVSALKNFI